MTRIQGKIYQMTNAAGTENRFPRTVIEAVYGLSSYLQTQFSNLADIYMPIEGITEVKTGQEFVYRKSPQTIKSKALTIDRIKGKTLAWNQLCDYTNTVSSSMTRSISGNEVTYKSAAGTNNNAAMLAFTQEHVYYLSFSYKSNIAYNVQHMLTSSSLEAATSFKKASFLGPRVDSGHSQVYWCNYSTLTANQWTLVLKDVVVIDLTLMFGSNLYTELGVANLDSDANRQLALANFEKMYNGNFSKNSGQLISNASAGLETVGFNLWDEEWEVGGLKIADGANYDTSDRIRSKNYIPVLPDTDYYCKGNLNNVCFYDANHSYISGQSSSSNTVRHTPQNCTYIRFETSSSYGAVYQNDICINFSDTSKNGQYEPYNSSVLPLNLSDLRVKSPNVWDEEWELGIYDATTGAKSDSTVAIRSKNFIPIQPSTTYYIKIGTANSVTKPFYYDANYNFLGRNSSYVQNGTFTTPSNAAYMTLGMPSEYGTTYHNDICINLSNPGHNGNYYPHGSFNPFPNGLCSAGNVYDEIIGNKVIRRVKTLDMGEANWQYITGGTYPYFAFKPDDVVVSNSFGLIVPRYSDVGVIYDASTATDKVYARNTGYIRIHDTAYTSAAAFKTAMSGLYLVYELATPEEFVLETPLSLQMTAGTTERRLPEDTASSVLAPFCCDMTYGGNPSDTASTSGYATMAGRLYTARKIWGQDFDGTNDVLGALAGVTNLNSLLYLGSSNVGIGQSSPAYKLDVSGTFRATGAATLNGTTTISNASFASALIINRAASGGVSAITYNSNGTTVGVLGVNSSNALVYYLGTDLNTARYIWHTGNDAKILLSRGVMASGTDANSLTNGLWFNNQNDTTQHLPSNYGLLVSLDGAVENTTYSGYYVLQLYQRSGAGLYYRAKSGDSWSNWNQIWHAGNSNLSTIDWACKNLTSSGAITTQQIEFKGMGSAGNGGFIDFHYNNSSADYTSRLIESASGVININNAVYASYGGNVGVGNSSPSYKLDVTGIIHATTGILANGYITAGAAASSSDASLKDNILSIPFAEALDMLDRLRGCCWDWNDKKPCLAGQHGSGLVAQEVQKVMPWAVLDLNGELSLNYNSLWGVAVPVMQSHEGRIKYLEARVKELEEQLKMR